MILFLNIITHLILIFILLFSILYEKQSIKIEQYYCANALGDATMLLLFSFAGEIYYSLPKSRWDIHFQVFS